MSKKVSKTPAKPKPAKVVRIPANPAFLQDLDKLQKLIGAPRVRRLSVG